MTLICPSYNCNCKKIIIKVIPITEIFIIKCRGYFFLSSRVKCIYRFKTFRNF